MALVTVSIPDDLERRLDRVARATGMTRSAFVERAIADVLERDAESALRELGALRTREGDEQRTGPLPADSLIAVARTA